MLTVVKENPCSFIWPIVYHGWQWLSCHQDARVVPLTAFLDFSRGRSRIADEMTIAESGRHIDAGNPESQDPNARLQALLNELTPQLEQRLWLQQVPSAARDLFSMAADSIGQVLDIKLAPQFESLSRLTDYYVMKDPEDVIDLLSKVDRTRFDGGHVIEVGRAMRYVPTEQGKLPDDFEFRMEAFSYGEIKMPYGLEKFSSFAEDSQLSRIFNRLGEWGAVMVRNARMFSEKKDTGSSFTEEVTLGTRPAVRGRKVTGERKTRFLDALFRSPDSKVPRRIWRVFEEMLFDVVAVPVSELASSPDALALDLSYDEGQYYLEGGEQRQVLNEEFWRRMRDEERDRVRYELERQSQQDPNVIWPAWIPKEDVYGPIRSQRSMDDQSFGPLPRFDSDSPLNEQQIREDRERLSPGDYSGRD